MNLGFINIPFPFIIFFIIIVFNVVAAINKKKKDQDSSTSIGTEKKNFGPIAYDLILKKKREEAKDNFTEEFVEEAFNINLVPSIAEVEKEVEPIKTSSPKKKFRFGLTQLQQAVVMKEILDKPKSLQ